MTSKKPANKLPEDMTEAELTAWAQAVAMGEIGYEPQEEPFERHARDIGLVVVPEADLFKARRLYQGAKKEFVVTPSTFIPISLLVTGGSKEYSRLSILEQDSLSPILIETAMTREGIYHVDPYCRVKKIESGDLTPDHPARVALDKFALWWNRPKPSYTTGEEESRKCEDLTTPLLDFGWYVKDLPDFYGELRTDGHSSREFRTLVQQDIVRKELVKILSKKGLLDQRLEHKETGKSGIRSEVLSAVLTLSDTKKAYFKGKKGQFSEDIFNKAWKIVRDGHNQELDRTANNRPLPK